MPGEQVWFQIIIRPVGDQWQDRGNSIISAVRAGKKPGGKGVATSFLKGLHGFGKMVLLQAIRPGAEAGIESSEVKLPASVEEALSGIEKKITKLGFETKIRILCIANDPVTAGIKCQSVGAAFKQFNTTNLNGFRVGGIEKNNFDAWEDFVTRSFIDYGSVFNIAELASVYHLPHKSVETPNIVWSGAKKGEPPANLPLVDNTPNDELTVLGLTNFRNVYREFGIKRDDRRRHIYIVGKSGTGKSTLIENMAINDVFEGKGVVIVDPHGELADKVLSCVPTDRINDVIVFDPADRSYPIGFNLLETVEDDFKGMVASGFVGIFKKIFGDSWGPRLEHILRNTVLALLDFPESTMLDIPRMLTDNRFRDRVVEKVQDSVIREFWVNEFAQYDAKFRTEAVSPILNKVGQFLATATIRNIVGQPHSKINIREIMDSGKILIVNLSRGKIGEDNSALLGAMMITKIQLAAMSRADVSVDKRRDCYLYVDEFQNFATESFAVILSEARKYNLCLTMANQYIEQMSEEVRSAVFGNAGTIVTFRVGGTDAGFLVKEFEPVFEANDLVNLDRYTVYLKLLIDGIAPPAFSAKTLPPVQKLTGNTEAIINHSHEKYSASRAYVEEQISNRSREEENELKAEAEAFRKGGLEAILVKNKPNGGGGGPDNYAQYNGRSAHQAPNHPQVTVSAPVVPEPSPKIDFASSEGGTPVSSVASSDGAGPASVGIQEERVGERAEEKVPAPRRSELENDEPKPDKPQRPRIFKFQNIIGDKIYKEQTARGSEKWFVGEDIDLDKMAELGVEMTEPGQKMMELAKRVREVGPQQPTAVTHNPAWEPSTSALPVEEKKESFIPKIAPDITPVPVEESVQKDVPDEPVLPSGLSQSSSEDVGVLEPEKVEPIEPANKEPEIVEDSNDDSRNTPSGSGQLSHGQIVRFD